MRPARLVLPALRWRPETGFAHEDRTIAEGLELGVGGFIIFGVPGARADEIAALTDSIRRQADWPIFLGADLERGAAQQARRLTACPPPAALAALEDPAVIQWAAATTGREARSIGLNWVFAPVADLDAEAENPIVQTRSFGADPAKVSAAVSLWVGAAQAEGVLACAKHYPGHGRTQHDSHNRLPAVHVPFSALESTDLKPFRAAIDAGVASVMTAHVAFPAWDPSGLPATLSPVMLGSLRTGLGFGGLIVTDALIMEGAQGSRSAGETEVAALAAGCDLLLYPPNPRAVVAALGEAIENGRLPAERVRSSLDRAAHALATLAGPPQPVAEPIRGFTAESVAARLLDQGLIRGPAPDLAGGVDLAIVDDDLGGWYAPGPNDLVRRELARLKCFERFGAGRIVLAFAEPRAAKGRAGFGPVAREQLAALVPGARLVVLFAHPRLAEQIPGDCPILLAWHRQPLMQEAVARWLVRRVGG